MASVSITELTDRFTKFAEHDKARDDLIKSLLVQVAKYEAENQDLIQRHQNVQELEESNRKLNRLVNKDAYVAVLIDGDGAKFLDHLVRNPERGAQEAALNLKKEVRRQLANTPFGLEDIPIVVRIFANLTGLAKSLRLANIINSENDMHIFAEQFTNSQAEFDFVNVGHGKENADSKMRKMFNHFYKNFQCKKIFFAGCHDKGYVHPLRELMGNLDAENRIVLLETTPAELPFKALNFPMTRFDTVFRSEPLNNEKKRTSPVASNRIPTSSTVFEPVRPPHWTSTALSAPVPQEVKPINTVSYSPRTQAAIIAAAEAGQRQAQTITYSSNGATSVNYARSYATVGGTNNLQNIDLQCTKSEKARTVKLNRENMRIDPPNKSNNATSDNISYKAKRDSIRPKAFCNNYYLSGGCERRDCYLEHDVELSKGEIAIHRFKARTSPCPAGPHCRNYDCYLSHHCPFGLGCTSAACKFSNTQYGDLHLSEKGQEPVKVWVEGQPFPDNL